MTDDTVVADPSPEPPPAKAAMTTGDKMRFVLRGIGQTLITLGLVVLLFVVYEVWITNLFSRAENDRIAHKTEQVWESGKDTLPLPGSGSSTIPIGTGIANIYLPRLGHDYHWTIVEGVSQDELAKGPGHYPHSQLPGQKGNFAVAGHRVGKGEPFLNVDKLRAGDAIVIETKSWWYVYRVLGAPAGSDPQKSGTDVPYSGGTKNVPGREIVDPSAGRVLLPVPNDQAVNKSDATTPLLTLTTCHPKFTAEKRMIIHAALEGKVSALDAQKKHVKAMPPAIGKLYSEVKV